MPHLGVRGPAKGRWFEDGEASAASLPAYRHPSCTCSLGSAPPPPPPSAGGGRQRASVRQLPAIGSGRRQESRRGCRIAVGETIILLRPPIPSISASTGVKRGGAAKRQSRRYCHARTPSKTPEEVRGYDELSKQFSRSTWFPVALRTRAHSPRSWLGLSAPGTHNQHTGSCKTPGLAC